MIIPWEELEESTLYNVLDSFILREGTDYGRQELSLEEKKSASASAIKGRKSGNCLV